MVGLAQNEYIWGLEFLYPISVYILDDLGIQSIIEPASGVGFTNSEPVTVRIYNYGGEPQTDFIVSFSHNGSLPYFDTVFTTLISGDTYDFTFDTTVDLSMGGSHSFEACTHLVNEECIINDCKTKTISGPLNCTLEGYVTNCLNGDPLEGATISCGTWIALTGADGYYSILDILPGTYDINCTLPGFCPFDTTITFTQGSGVTLDIELCPAHFEVDPDTLYVTMDPNTTTTSSVTLTNPGICDMDWNVYVSFNQKELFDLQFQYPCAIGDGEAGIETDGDFIYTTKWNGPEFINTI